MTCTCAHIVVHTKTTAGLCVHSLHSNGFPGFRDWYITTMRTEGHLWRSHDTHNIPLLIYTQCPRQWTGRLDPIGSARHSLECMRAPIEAHHWRKPLRAHTGANTLTSCPECNQVLMPLTSLQLQAPYYRGNGSQGALISDFDSSVELIGPFLLRMSTRLESNSSSCLALLCHQWYPSSTCGVTRDLHNTLKH